MPDLADGATAILTGVSSDDRSALFSQGGIISTRPVSDGIGIVVISSHSTVPGWCGGTETSWVRVARASALAGREPGFVFDCGGAAL